jgi:hypothetical protein
VYLKLGLARLRHRRLETGSSVMLDGRWYWKETEILLNRPDGLGLVCMVVSYHQPHLYSTGYLHLSEVKLQSATDFVLSMGFLRIAPVPTGC